MPQQNLTVAGTGGDHAAARSAARSTQWPPISSIVSPHCHSSAYAPDVALVSDSVTGAAVESRRPASCLRIRGTVPRKTRSSNQLKMTKQEIKDEHKESEGNPQIKAKIRAIRRDQARQRMMKAVPTATAVIVNPTHFAVALKYEPDTHGRAAGRRQRQELPGAAHPPDGRRQSGAAHRESAAGAAPCTNPSTSARKFRRISIAPSPKFWRTFSRS